MEENTRTEEIRMISRHENKEGDQIDKIKSG